MAVRKELWVMDGVLGTLIVGLLLLTVVVLIIFNMIKDKKAGKSIQCGGDCSHCGGQCMHK